MEFEAVKHIEKVYVMNSNNIVGMNSRGGVVPRDGPPEIQYPQNQVHES